MAHSFGDVVLLPLPFPDQELVLRTMEKLSASDLRILRKTIAHIIG